MITVVFIVLNPITISEGRQPRGLMKVNDKRVDAWLRFEVENNVFYEADTFRVRIAVSALPFDFDENWWTSAEEIFIELFAGFPADPDAYSEEELSSLTYGRVDDLAFDPVSREITISGRDLTAELIDTKTTETFQNLTSSQIAIQIAERHGLTPVVTPTKQFVGKYYQIDNVRMNQQRSEWDMLTALAGQEQFSVYIKRRELHFKPKVEASADPYVLKWEKPSDQNGAFGFNGMRLNFSRALTLARGVVVTVMSMAQKGQKVKATYPNKIATIKPGRSAPAAQQYTYTYSNLTFEGALQKAKELHEQISQHEVKLSATLPADNVLTVDNLISVIGTETAFDQTYYPESINREMDRQTGYVMSVRAKNHSPDAVVPL